MRLLSIFFCALVVVEGKLRTFELNISKGLWNPNCDSVGGTEVMMVNGQYPGPPLRATTNDDIHVIVRNHGDEPTTIHYHGILQIGTTESDGMPNVTQAPILPGGEFHHRFRLIDQAGTFFYHAHSALQDDSVQGPFIIYPRDDAWPASSSDGETTKNGKDEDEDQEDEIKLETQDKKKKKDKKQKDSHSLEYHGPVSDGPYHYDDERIIQLSEWWAQDPVDRLDYYLGDSYKGFIAADTYLINGRGPTLKSNNSNHKKERGDDSSCPGYAALDVSPGKTYRLRVIGALSFATVGFSIAKHTMTIIEMDGNLIQPFETDYLEVSSGQRYSVLLKTEQPAGTSYNMGVQAYWITNTTATGHAILNYLEEASTDKKKSKKTVTRTDLVQNSPSLFARTSLHEATDPALPIFPPATNQWVFPEVTPLVDEGLDFDAPPDRTIVLMPKEHLVAGHGNRTRWMINDRPMPSWQVPIIDQLLDRRNAQNGHTYKMNHTAMALNKAGTWDGYDDTLQTYPIQDKEVVDVVIHTTTLINHGICAGKRMKDRTEEIVAYLFIYFAF